MRLYVYSRLLMTFILLFLGGCALVKNEKATWVWNAHSLEKPLAMLSFFEEENVKDVYVQLDLSVPDSVYQSFLTDAHDQNIRVHALDGSPDYTEQELAAFLKRVRSLDWDGIHLDIEPYLSEEWESDQKQAVHMYERLIKQAADSGFVLGVDIPFWYDEIPSSANGTLAEFVVERADYTVIMAYRDSSEQILKAARTELALGRSTDKEVLIAVETIEDAEAEGISFFGKSAAYFENEIEKAAKECECRIAVHHAESWQALVNQ